MQKRALLLSVGLLAVTFFLTLSLGEVTDQELSSVMEESQQSQKVPQPDSSIKNMAFVGSLHSDPTGNTYAPPINATTSALVSEANPTVKNAENPGPMHFVVKNNIDEKYRAHLERVSCVVQYRPFLPSENSLADFIREDEQNFEDQRVESGQNFEVTLSEKTKCVEQIDCDIGVKAEGEEKLILKKEVTKRMPAKGCMTYAEIEMKNL